MARPHIAYRGIKKGAVKSAGQLFKSKPWRGTDEEIDTKYREFLARVSRAYGVPTPKLELIQMTGRNYEYLVQSQSIRLTSRSVLNLFRCYRYHLQSMGMVPGTSGFSLDDDDAFKWACSLYYSASPKLFRKAVRQGKVPGVGPEDLLKTGSTYVDPEVERQAQQRAAIAEMEAEMEDEPIRIIERGLVEAAERITSELPVSSVQEAEDTPEFMLGYHAHLDSEGLSQTTVKKHLRITRKFLEWAMANHKSVNGYDITVDNGEAWIHSLNLTDSSAQTYRGSVAKFAGFKHGVPAGV